MVSEVTEFIVVLGHGGGIASQGGVKTVTDSYPKFKDDAQQEVLESKSSPCEPVNEESTEIVTERPNHKGRLKSAGEVVEGHVGWPALKLFLFALRGIGLWFAYLAGFVLANVAALLQMHWLGIWARVYDTPAKQVNVAL
ncbi:hypothetical protein OPQ81_006482 [Rhizoctonia solani]|nr:hypothetical protein OPQ81_006482 [Rhizoctonia solani]